MELTQVNNSELNNILSNFDVNPSKFTYEKWYKSGTYVTMYGILASFISYYIGKCMNKLFK